MGRKVLIVDDDARNLFALTSLLERQQMQVLVADNGQEAIAVLDQDPGVDLVLMDIMMPGSAIRTSIASSGRKSCPSYGPCRSFGSGTRVALQDRKCILWPSSWRRRGFIRSA